MDSEHFLIIAPQPQLPPICLNPAGVASKQAALESAALIGKVTDRDSKIVAVRAQQSLKSVIAMLEKSRVELKEPALIYGRAVDSFASKEKLELEKEFGRVSNAVKDFDDGERRRIAEEERFQRLELERIEREKQAELASIAAEQAAREAEARRLQEEAAHKVREAQEAAAKLAADATTKKQREIALAAQAAAQREAAIVAEKKLQAEEQLRSQAAASASASAAVQERAAAAAYVESRPIEMTRVEGQVNKTDWEITILNPWELAKYHPDCVKIEPLLTPIKAALNEGRTVKGIRAEKVIKPDVRVRSDRNLI